MLIPAKVAALQALHVPVGRHMDIHMEEHHLIITDKSMIETSMAV